MSEALEKARQLRAMAARLVLYAKELEDQTPLTGEAFPLGESRDPVSHGIIDREALRQTAASEYANRRSRRKFFDGDFFGEAAWDILLDLFQARLDGRMITVTSACIAADVPSTTALRWLKILECSQLVERLENSNDQRSAWVRLTDVGLRSMASYFDSCHNRAKRENRIAEDRLIGEFIRNQHLQPF
jgi:DNA-binding MarR family transcriptional regulator